LKTLKWALEYLLKTAGKIIANPKRQKYSRSINYLVSAAWCILLAAIIWGAWRYRGEIFPYLGRLNLLKLSLSSIYYLAALILAVIGWSLIIQVFAPGISWWTHVRIYLVTLVARRLPGTVWYIGGRMVLYKRLGVSNIKTSVASMVEMITNLGTNCLVGGLLLPLGVSMQPGLAAILILGALVGGALIHPRIIFWLMSRLNRPLDKPLKFRQPASWVFIRIGGLIAGGLMIAQIVRSFQAISSQNVITTIGAFAISGAASYLTFFLPSSFGMSDITLTALLSTFLPLSLAAVVALLFRAMTTLFEVGIGLVFYIILRTSPDLTISSQA
jgi:glycosyltransferase 2 family protein